MASKDKRRRDRQRQQQQRQGQNRPPPIAAILPPPTELPKWELRLEARALREGCVENQETRDLIATRLAEIILNPKMKARYVITAAKTLIQADVAQQRIDAARLKTSDPETAEAPLSPELARKIYEATNDGSDPNFGDRPATQSAPGDAS